MKLSFFLIFSFLIFSTIHCGGSGTETVEEPTQESETINTAKLVGTPFEGMETGDDISWYTSVRYGQYLTETVDYVPIPVFLAFFTPSQEETVKEGVAIANDGADFEAFEVIDTWQDDARVIYKVNVINDPDTGISQDYSDRAIGKTIGSESYYENKILAGIIVPDWQIELKTAGINKWTVAHELGHTFGILNHAMIDYENDVVLSEEPNNGLEENSLMQADGGGSSPTLDDYNYMMHMQGELLLRHLGELGL